MFDKLVEYKDQIKPFNELRNVKLFANDFDIFFIFNFKLIHSSNIGAEMTKKYKCVR